MSRAHAGAPSLALGLAILVGGVSFAQEKAPEKPKAPSPRETDKAKPASGEHEAPNTPGYKIGPADVLQLIVWKEPDVTRDLEVRFDGMVTVPLIGDLQAAGRRPNEVAETISKALERYIETPRVTVAVSRANSARFYVVGQVTKSGEFPLTGRTTVLQGLALAGGFKEFAKTESIVVVSQDQVVAQVNYKRIADGKDMSQNLVLSPGDTVVVP
jgi:polysaccharide export outer membrane protein